MTVPWKAIAMAALTATAAVTIVEERRIADLEHRQATVATLSHVTDQPTVRWRAASAASTPTLTPELAASTMANARAAREALWSRTYTRSAACQAPLGNDEFVACGNEYARAHRQFIAEHPLQAFMPKGWTTREFTN